MSKNEVANIDLQLRTEKAEIYVDKIANNIEELGRVIESVSDAISKLFSSVQTEADILATELGQIAEPIIKLSESLNAVAESDFSALVTELTNLKSALNDIFVQMGDQQAQDLATSIGSYLFAAAQLGWDVYDKLSEKKAKSNGNRKGGIKVKVRKKSSNSKTTSSKASASGIAAGGFSIKRGVYIKKTCRFSEGLLS